MGGRVVVCPCHFRAPRNHLRWPFGASGASRLGPPKTRNATYWCRKTEGGGFFARVFGCEKTSQVVFVPDFPFVFNAVSSFWLGSKGGFFAFFAALYIRTHFQNRPPSNNARQKIKIYNYINRLAKMTLYFNGLMRKKREDRLRLRKKRKNLLARAGPTQAIGRVARQIIAGRPPAGPTCPLCLVSAPSRAMSSHRLAMTRPLRWRAKSSCSWLAVISP